MGAGSTDGGSWAAIALGGIPNKAQVGDMGIDGRSFPMSAIPRSARGKSPRTAQIKAQQDVVFFVASAHEAAKKSLDFLPSMLTLVVILGLRIKDTIMARNKKPNTTEALILGILLNQERYGREILAEYERAARRKIALGSLYVTLGRMEQAGFIKSRIGESSHERGGNRRKYFRITGAGVRAFDALSHALTEVRNVGLAH